jgi:hypothetical protein
LEPGRGGRLRCSAPAVQHPKRVALQAVPSTDYCAGVLRLILALLIVVAAASAAEAVRCDPTGADAMAIAAARADVAASCDCASAATHHDYVRCAVQVVRARVALNQLPPSCRGAVQRCVVRSVCGKPAAVTCCTTTAAGANQCRIKRDASHCTAPPGGTACVGNYSSCCDACTAGGCALVPTPTPTPSPSPTPTSCGGPCPPIRTVFIIAMENRNWSTIVDNPAAPYINQTLLPVASYATQYYNPPGIHPSEPNYIWLEAGTNFGIANDLDPAANHQSSTNHLVTLLNAAGITWKSYQEDISGTVCPLVTQGLYAPKHNPMIFFDDVTNTNDANSAYCIAHIRPYTELETDLTNDTVARYNFITPNLCNDMHDSCAPLNNRLAQGDAWLSTEVPKILQSAAYQNDGVLFITWDEGAGGDGPIGMIVLSSHAKGGGYSNSIHYTHSSTLRTLQEIFGVTPFLGDATNATDLSDLFAAFP